MVIRRLRRISRYARENSFAYDVEGFKQSGRDLIEYQEKESLDIPLDCLSGLAIGQDDRLYVSGGSSILVFDPARSQVSRITAAGSVNCLAVDENGSVFVGLSDHVEVYHSHGGLDSLGILGRKCNPHLDRFDPGVCFCGRCRQSHRVENGYIRDSQLIGSETRTRPRTSRDLSSPALSLMWLSIRTVSSGWPIPDGISGKLYLGGRLQKFLGGIFHGDPGIFVLL